MIRLTPDVETLIDLPLGCGEGAFWHPGEQALYFVDILAPALFRYDPERAALTRWDMPSEIGSFGLCPDGRAIVALRQGIHFYDFETGRLELVAHPEAHLPGNRLNDGKVAPDGRFWVGSMDDTPDKKPVGSLYRVDPDGTCTKMLDGLIVSNGLAWSPDGRTMFHSDSRGKYVQAFDYDLATGVISNQRRLVTLEEEDGRPDGAAGDAEGCYWSAGVSAGCLNRIAPDGAIERKIVLPHPSPTMPCFGGPDLRTVYVTSLTRPQGGVPGTLMRFRSDIAGTPVAFFGQPLAA
ncbi:MAG: SMP-30/gluconolactonase/LRE family protein [Alsobacter sp.]